jgi:hypothetical protein
VINYPRYEWGDFIAQNGTRAIARAVIDNDNFHLGDGGRADGIHNCSDGFAFIVTGNNDR